MSQHQLSQGERVAQEVNSAPKMISHLQRLALLWLAIVSACRRPAPIPEPPDVRPWVVGEAVANLNEAGHFHLPPPRSPTGAAILFPERAIELATAYVHQRTSYKDLPRNFHGERLSHMDKEHGDIIDFQSLRPGPRAYFPQIPYGPVADSLPEYVREAYGPYYLVPFYSRGGLEVMVVSVAAEATGLRIDQEGRVRPPGGTGSLPFNREVVSAGVEYPVPLTPECAVRLVAEATGRKVIRVPELIHPGRLWHPAVTYWKLALDQPVAVRGDSTRRVDNLREIYIGLEPRVKFEPGALRPVLFRPLAEQPTVDTAKVVVPSLDRPPGEPPARYTVEIPIRPGSPVRFEKARLVHGSLEPKQRHFPCQSRPR